MNEIYSRCPYRRVEGGCIGEIVFPYCMGSRCAGFITFSSRCEVSGQFVDPDPDYLHHPEWQ